MAQSPAPSQSAAKGSGKTLLFLLLGLAGGGLGALLALFAGAASWSDAKLFIVLGVAIGIALAAALAPNLLHTKDREASAPKR